MYVYLVKFTIERSHEINGDTLSPVDLVDLLCVLHIHIISLLTFHSQGHIDLGLGLNTGQERGLIVPLSTLAVPTYCRRHGTGQGISITLQRYLILSIVSFKGCQPHIENKLAVLNSKKRTV